MYQEERLYEILNMLKDKKTLSNKEIMDLFDISRDTARRDIIRLVDEGAAIRTHGGIALPSIQNEVQDYKNRIAINSEEKSSLGIFATRYLTSDQLCFFDVSTTIQALCNTMKEAEICAYTNSLDNLNVLLNKQCEVHLLGGKVNLKNRFLYGSETITALERVYFDIAFLGAAAVQEDGIYVTDQEDAFIKKSVAKRAKVVCVLADSDKFTKCSRYKALDYKEISIIVTNAKVSPDMYQIMKNAGVHIEVVNQLL